MKRLLCPINPVANSSTSFFGAFSLSIFVKLEHLESLHAIIPKSFLLVIRFYIVEGQEFGKRIMYETITSPGIALNERIIQQVFPVLPDRGLLVVIMDKNGRCRASDEAEFTGLKISKNFLEEIRGRVDDGAEPVVIQSNSVGIAAAQLATERTDCGYVFIALPRCGDEFALANVDMFEALLGQISLVAELIEKNTLLQELHLKNYKFYDNNMVSSN